MITFPCCKINLGLNIVAKRPDGYHDLETVFYPVPLCDVLEIKKMDEEFPSPTPIDLKVTGHAVECDERNNLVVKAYHLLAKDYELPRIHVHLVKRIPMQAGLGGAPSLHYPYSNENAHRVIESYKQHQLNHLQVLPA